jgi:hypothetical protein
MSDPFEQGNEIQYDCSNNQNREANDIAIWLFIVLIIALCFAVR